MAKDIDWSYLEEDRQFHRYTTVKLGDVTMNNMAMDIDLSFMDIDWSIVESEWQYWQFHRYADLKLGEPVGSMLTNDIHPMFSYVLGDSTFESCPKARWANLAVEDFKLLNQTLRLATQFLESAPSVDAICSILYGKRHIPSDDLGHKNRPFLEFCRHGLSFTVARQWALEALKKLGGSLLFHIADQVPHAQLGLVQQGATVRNFGDHPKGIAVTKDPKHKGLASVICINRGYLNILNDMVADPCTEEFLIQKLNFELAVTICHEVIHAVNYAVDSDLFKRTVQMAGIKLSFNEPFYKGQHVADLGRFWEKQVFGGACQQSFPNPKAAFFVCEWPSWMFQFNNSLPQRAPLKRQSCKWRVPTEYIQDIHTQQFWDNVKLEIPRNIRALRISKRFASASDQPADDALYYGCNETHADDAPPKKRARLQGKSVSRAKG